MLELLLKSNSVFVGITLYALSVGVIIAGRGYFEGRFYNVAFSSCIGDAFLIVIVLIAKGVLERDMASLLNLNWLISIGLSLLTGILVNSLAPAKQVMDLYHNLVVIPLLFYLVVFVSSYPIFWHGTPIQKMGSAGCFFIWLALFSYDIYSGRLDQRTWLGQDFFR